MNYLGHPVKINLRKSSFYEFSGRAFLNSSVCCQCYHMPSENEEYQRVSSRDDAMVDFPKSYRDARVRIEERNGNQAKEEAVEKKQKKGIFRDFILR